MEVLIMIEHMIIKGLKVDEARARSLIDAAVPAAGYRIVYEGGGVIRIFDGRYRFIKEVQTAEHVAKFIEDVSMAAAEAYVFQETQNNVG
jgi:hypothetical protein